MQPIIVDKGNEIVILKVNLKIRQRILKYKRN